MLVYIFFTLIAGTRTDNIQQLQQKVEWLSSENAKLWSEVNSFNTFCGIHQDGKCGACRCRDSYKLQRKFYCDCQHLTPERDCRAFYEKGLRTSGKYIVHLSTIKLIQVWCDMETDGGGWTVIQRRRDGSEKFFRNWDDYKIGFGDLSNEHWLGNDNIFLLSLQAMYPKRSELRIELEDWQNNKKYAKYNNFQISDEKAMYKIHISGYSGNAGDSLSYENDNYFTTYDQDHDKYPVNNCAKLFKGGWWFNSCHNSHLNGKYYDLGDYSETLKGTGMHWHPIDQHQNSLKSTEMKIRRK